jgi:antitoxin FitA
MTTLTIALPDEQLQKLKEITTRLNVTPEELERIGVEELIARPETEFQNSVNYVLEKNAELYKRLA